MENEKNQQHYKNYLKLTKNSNDDRLIIIYQEDEDGNPVLDYRNIGIIKIRGNNSRVTLAFDSDNDYKFIRYEALEKNPERSVNLKELVDKKLSCLENKIDSEKVDQNV
ncbi:MAG: hypothetical protein AABW90_00100 [Nanoarchaeota archaeon]